MKRWIFLFLSLTLTACAVAPGASVSPGNLADFGPAPALVGEVWLNTPAPLKMADLRGKVVLVDMWTLGCINCQHVIPSLRKWYDQYSSQGLVVIGNHYPEFGYERSLSALKQAVIDLNVPYPVVQDNDGTNWNAFKTRYWPTLYLIDKRGRIREIYIGEGGYEDIEAHIQALLKEPFAPPAGG